MTWLHGFSWVRVLALSFNHVLSFVADRPSSVTPTCGKWFSSRSLSCRAFLKLMLTGVMDGTRCCAMAAVQWSSCWEGVICCHATNACVKLIIIIVWPRDEILTDYQIQPSIRAMMAAAKISRSHKIKLMCLVWVLNLKIWYLFLAHSLVNRSECFSFLFVCFRNKYQGSTCCSAGGTRQSRMTGCAGQLATWLHMSWLSTHALKQHFQKTWLILKKAFSKLSRLKCLYSRSRRGWCIIVITLVALALSMDFFNLWANWAQLKLQSFVSFVSIVSLVSIHHWQMQSWSMGIN